MSQTRAFLRYSLANRLDTEYLQTVLLKLGYPAGPVDGRYGLLTLRAVVGFQNDKNLSADGMVGDTTWRALTSAITPTPAPRKKTKRPPVSDVKGKTPPTRGKVAKV